jgi:hypothetical protein
MLTQLDLNLASLRKCQPKSLPGVLNTWQYLQLVFKQKLTFVTDVTIFKLYRHCQLFFCKILKTFHTNDKAKQLYLQVKSANNSTFKKVQMCTKQQIKGQE